MSPPLPIRLFSYGTLRQEAVQLVLFGRRLQGEPDAMTKHRQEQVEITDPSVLATSGERFHPVAIPSANPADAVEGEVFVITQAELKAADDYETADYTRALVQLRSGNDAWVFVRA